MIIAVRHQCHSAWIFRMVLDPSLIGLRENSSALDWPVGSVEFKRNPIGIEGQSLLVRLT